MARYNFSDFSNGDSMSSVRTTITDNFNAAMAKPLDGTNPLDAGNNTVYLVAIATNGTTYTMPSTKYLTATGTANGANLSLTGNLTVSGNTTLGSDSNDVIHLKGTVTGLNGTFTSLIGEDNSTVNASVINADTINASTITANEIDVSSLNVGGSAYKPFYVSNSTPAASYQDRLWINTAATVPYLQYYNGSTWVSIGAVFG